MLSIIIPSRNEIFLEKTIRDILEKATGEIEVFPILDGYEPPANEIVDDPRVKYIRLEKQDYTQKRHGINQAVDMAKGEYVMSVDAHCMFAKGFDEVLVRDHQPNWVQVPRRHRLDAENWCIQEQSDDRPPIDYEYVMYPGNFDRPALHGFKWDERTKERADIMIDDIMTMQASTWFMTKAWYKKMGFMQIEGFSGWGQEAEEICFKTWMRGGECKVNKNTWYAHLHKGRKYGRMYYMSRESNRKCYAYSYDYFMNNRDEQRVHDFDWLIDKFMPIPKWKKDWRERLDYNKDKK